MAIVDHYATLGVLPEATEDQIRSAWKLRAREFHPDRNKHKDATKQFSAASEAYEVLKDPVSRNRYDAERKLGTQAHVEPPPYRGSSARRPGSPSPAPAPDWDYGSSANNFRDRWSGQEQARAREKERTPEWWEELYEPSGGRQAERVHHDPFQGFVNHAVEQEELEDSYGQRFVFDRMGTPRVTREGVRNPFRTPFRKR